MTTAATPINDVAANDYKVADISLADFGRREITLAEAEMPALMTLRKKYAAGEASCRREDHRLHSHDRANCRSYRDAG
jgi:hypothetical protein